MNWDFAAELRRFGPTADYPPPTAEAARRYCGRVAGSHYENFAVATLLLPRRLVPHFHAVYAFCRWADDLADETGGGAESLRLLTWWRDQLFGESRHPVLIALRATRARFSIPESPFLKLLGAFERDQRQAEYDSFADLLTYCDGSANPVGHLVLYLFDCFTPDRARLSDETCTGLQLANFWQDVARDRRMGRIYLPRAERERFGVAPADLDRPEATPAFRELLRFQVNRTRGYFERGLPLLGMVPRRVRADLDLFTQGGLATLRAIERQGFDVLKRRPVVGKREKLGLLLRAAVRAARG